MTSTDSITLVCPVCEGGFDSQHARDFGVGERESVFCPRFLGANPLPYLIHLCPQCGFVGTVAEYEPLDEDHLRERDKLARALRDIGVERITTGTDRYRRLALLHIHRGTPSLAVADAYLKASWCARLDAEPGEADCQRAAAKYFALAIASGDVGAEDRPTIERLIEELRQRLASVTGGG